MVVEELWVVVVDVLGVVLVDVVEVLGVVLVEVVEVLGVVLVRVVVVVTVEGVVVVDVVVQSAAWAVNDPLPETTTLDGFSASLPGGTKTPPVYVQNWKAPPWFGGL